MKKSKSEFPIIDDERYEIEAELAVYHFEQLDLRKKLRRMKAIVAGYRVAAFALPGITLTRAISSGEATSTYEAAFQVAISFSAGVLLFLSGRLLKTAVVDDIQRDIELAAVKARRAGKKLQKPLLGVVAPR